MKNKLKPKIAATLVSFLICSNSWGALIPTAPSLTIGGRTFTDLSNLIVLVAQVQTATRATTFRKPNASSGYPVTAGKTLTICAIQVNGTTGSAGVADLTFAQTTADMGYDTASALTGPTFPGGFSANNGRHISVVISTSNITPPEKSFIFPIAATDFLTVISDAATTFVTAYGYEAHDCGS